ncbi:MAG: UDP-3-O-(3-hydroxymyristoyl)glucosamine N-acyltransferase [Gammaproteobacteria bacterium]|nr:UDP-3-O-(3-hydroxymyristoyl)glucosamine N-acyltransferase [Gammaproteobacteria bacterium]
MLKLDSKQFKLQDLADYSSSRLLLNNADPELLITGVSTLANATISDLSFYTNVLYRDDLLTTKAGLIIVSSKNAGLIKSAALINDNPHVVYAKIAKLFLKKSSNKSGIHPTAIIGSNCNIASSASLGPYVVIGNNVTIADDVILKAGVTVGDNCFIDQSTLIYPKVVLYDDISVGKNSIIHSGAIIGSDGFGFAFNHDKSWVKVPQLGSVKIGNNVEIGANTTIDCGAVEDTVIEDGVKLDNQIQIAHNVIIGKNTIIAAQVGIAGSSKIGENCAFGGGSAVSGHLNVANGVKLAGFSTIAQSIQEPGGFYASGTGPAIPYLKWRRLTVHLEHLDKYIVHLKKLIKTQSLNNSNSKIKT